MISFRLILLVFLLFITGCAQQISTSSVPNEQWREQLSTVKDFNAEGKMAFISPEDRQSANFIWQQLDKDYSLSLNTFIGTNVLKLTQQDQLASVLYDGKEYQSADAQQLVYQLSGWVLPMDEPQQWLLGNIAAQDAQFDQLQRLTQASWQSPNGLTWQIKYSNYEAYNGVWLPSRISLIQDNIRVKLQINDWQL